MFTLIFKTYMALVYNSLNCFNVFFLLVKYPFERKLFTTSGVRIHFETIQMTVKYM